MSDILPTIDSPHDLQRLSPEQLEQLAGEMRRALTEVAGTRTAHFASNLGVVELCLALHRVFDFSRDRLIWDTGHQIYPHKLITGRFSRFGSIRTKGGLMGYPNPAESDYDLFMTGHAGSSVSTALGLASGDDLLGRDDRWLTALAVGSGGRVAGLVDLPRLVRSIPPRAHVERLERVWRPWNSGFTIALVAGLLVLEWIWRKWEGLV